MHQIIKFILRVLVDRNIGRSLAGKTSLVSEDRPRSLATGQRLAFGPGGDRGEAGETGQLARGKAFGEWRKVSS
jgi:hypothetical protein